MTCRGFLSSCVLFQNWEGNQKQASQLRGKLFWKQENHESLERSTLKRTCMSNLVALLWSCSILHDHFICSGILQGKPVVNCNPLSSGFEDLRFPPTPSHLLGNIIIIYKKNKYFFFTLLLLLPLGFFLLWLAHVVTSTIFQLDKKLFKLIQHLCVSFYSK